MKKREVKRGSDEGDLATSQSAHGNIYFRNRDSLVENIILRVETFFPIDVGGLSHEEVSKEVRRRSWAVLKFENDRIAFRRRRKQIDD